MIQYDEGLTPIEEYNGIFYKRDDLYAPYGEDFVTGGKIRQCRDLIKTNLDHIKEECDSTISTASSIHSPQAVIVSKVAEEFGLKSIIGFGNTTVEKALKKKPMKMCADLGSEMVVLSESQGFNNVLYANLNKLAEERPMFKVLFGYAAQRYRSSIIGRIAEQIENVECDTLYVPLGSGMTFTGIIEGVRLFQKQFKVVALQPFGYDRRKDIHKNLEGMEWDYEYEYHMGDYPYNKLLQKNVGFELDMFYESKSFEMMQELMTKDEKSCFWCIGNSNYIRG
tara:strand:+ start:1834 stop:2676 length:843 start_codon:yes stop_codon:yes gene_type:complete